MTKAVLLAVIASTFWGFGMALQKVGVSASIPKVTVGQFFTKMGATLKALFFNPVWLFGTGAMVGGMLCYVNALNNGDISVVQPIINLAILISALFGVIFLKEKVVAVEWAGMAVMALGVVFIAMNAEEPTSVHPTTGKLVLMMAVFIVFIIGAFSLSKYSSRINIAFSLSIAAGFTFSLANISGKLLTQRIDNFSLIETHTLIAMITDFPIWIVILANIFGFTFQQTAYANGRISLTGPIQTIVANTAPVVAAIMIFNESFGPARAAGIILTAVGVAMFALRKEEEPAQKRSEA